MQFSYLPLKSNLSALPKIETMSRKKLQSSTTRSKLEMVIQFIFPPPDSIELLIHRRKTPLPWGRQVNISHKKSSF